MYDILKIWYTMKEVFSMKKNDQITTIITGIQSYGVFVQVDEYVGLVHISELSEYFISAIEELFQVGDQIETIVLEVDEENKRLKLSYKQANPIHPKIQKMIKIKKGFHPLAKALPHWIEKAKKK
jgi:general stress protein 13